MLVEDLLALYILSVDVGGRSKTGWNAQSYFFPRESLVMELLTLSFCPREKLIAAPRLRDIKLFPVLVTTHSM